MCKATKRTQKKNLSHAPTKATEAENEAYTKTHQTIPCLFPYSSHFTHTGVKSKKHTHTFFTLLHSLAFNTCRHKYTSLPLSADSLYNHASLSPLHAH